MNKTPFFFCVGSDSVEWKIEKSSFKNAWLLWRCCKISTWLKKIRELSTEKVGSSRILARTTSFKYCNR